MDNDGYLKTSDYKLFPDSDTDSNSGKSDFDDEYQQMKPTPKEFDDKDIVPVKPVPVSNSWAEVVRMNPPEIESQRNVSQPDNLRPQNAQSPVSKQIPVQQTLEGPPLIRSPQPPYNIPINAINIQPLQFIRAPTILPMQYGNIPTNMTHMYVPSNPYIHPYGVYNGYQGLQQTNAVNANNNLNHLQRNGANYEKCFREDVPRHTNPKQAAFDLDKCDMAILEKMWPSESLDPTLYNERNKVLDVRDLMFGVTKDYDRDYQLFKNIQSAFKDERFVKNGSCVYLKVNKENCDELMADGQKSEKMKTIPENQKEEEESAPCPKCDITDTDLIIYRLSLIFLILLLILSTRFFLNMCYNFLFDAFVLIYLNFIQLIAFLFSIPSRLVS